VDVGLATGDDSSGYVKENDYVEESYEVHYDVGSRFDDW
jgi:hypothetical protein